MKRAFSIVIPIMILAILGAIGASYFHYKSLFPSTEDAYVQAHIVNIAPRINGTVTAVYVEENQYVKKGQPLFSLDKTPYDLTVRQAQAKLEQIQDQLKAAQMQVDSDAAKLEQSEAELTNTQLSTARTLSLAKKGYASKADGDNAIKNFKVAKQTVAAAKSQLQQSLSKRGALGDKNAQLRSAKNTLDKAMLDLSYTTIKAPADGYIENFDLRVGATLTAYNPVFALVEARSFWVQANFKETDLARIRPNQPVKIKLDMYPNFTYTGKITSLSNSSTSSFSLLPPENASANWVKVTQRFPIRIAINDLDNVQYPLRVGASASIVVDTK